MLVLIDNYDSFTYNLVHFLGELGAACEVFRNDKIAVADVMKMQPKGIVLSPGPCTPNEAGICLELIETAGPTIPILGVCLGHQAIGQAYGGKVVRAPVLMHGKLSKITNKAKGVFKGLPKTFEVTRYHSLIVERAGEPARLSRRHGGDEPGRQEPGHGPAAQIPSRARCAVPPREHRLRARPRAACQLPRHCGHQSTPAQRARRPPRRLSENYMDAQPSQELRQLIQKVSGGATLSEEEIRTALDQMTAGAATAAQMGAFLMALRVRGETVEEIAEPRRCCATR